MNIETAGSRLKRVRQERGLSLEDIQKKTKIHLNVLRAIEGDSISNLNPIYLKGFIKIYCSYLGLEAKDFTGQGAQPQKSALNSASVRPLGTRIENKPTFINKDDSFKLGAISPLVNLKKLIVLLVIAAVIIFLGISLVKSISARPKNRLARAKIAMPVSAPKPTAVKQNKVNDDLSSGFNLSIFARGKSWISAKVDGKVVFHGVLARGRNEAWHAREKVELSLGDAGAVELQINDQRFANLGRHGQSLKNIVINKDGLKIAR